MTARSPALLLALLALAVAASPAAAQSRVSSGRLSADAASNPWHLTLREDGRAILAESGGRGSGPLGALGFRTAAGWSRATRVLSSRREGSALSLQLATTDAQRRLAVRIAPDGEGVIRLAAAVDGPGLLPVTHTGIAFEARGGERYLGFGERSNAVDQRGGDVESYVSDGPYQRIERPVIRTFVPPWGLRDRDDSTYFPMPWLLSTAGYGVLVQNTETSLFRLGDRSTWGLEAQAPRLELRVFAGPRPADALRRLTRHTGRQPAAAARWFHGPWFQPTGDEAEQIEMVRRLRRGDVPASAVNTFLHYLPCGDQEGIRDRQRARTAALKQEGVAVTTYFNPMVCSTYPQAFGPASAAGALTKNTLGVPYLYRYSASTDDLFLVGQYDFSSSQGTRLFQGRLAEATRDGYDGWMEDFGEYTPPDSRSANGMTGAQMHNLYPVLYHRASYEFARRQSRPTAGYVRSGFTGVHPYAQLVWGGDPTTSFGFDGLESAVRQGLTMGLSGISRWGSDIGGFFALGDNKLTPELLKRWIEVGAVSGIMRTEANGVALPSRDRPQIDDPDVLPVWRRWAKLRTQLLPYLAAADAHYRRTGLPLMRHLSLTNPTDPAARSRDDQFMFGPDLLAAPVLADGQRTRSVYLPRGRWVDLWRTLSYDNRRGGLLLGRPRSLNGGRSVTLAAPLEELPLLARAGALIPLLPAEVDTVSDYGRGGGAVRLADRRERFELVAFPRGRSSALVGNRGGRLKSVERRRRWDLRITGARRARYRVRASLGTLRRPFGVRAVCVDRKRVRRRSWRYDRRRRALRVDLRVRRRSSVLTASRGRCARKRRR